MRKEENENEKKNAVTWSLFLIVFPLTPSVDLKSVSKGGVKSGGSYKIPPINVLFILMCDVMCDVW
jgi:hypothetical protein